MLWADLVKDSPGGDASACWAAFELPKNGARSCRLVDTDLLPAKRELCYRAGQVSFRPRCSSVTGQHGWLGNAHARPHWASARIIAIGGRMSMIRSEFLSICISRCPEGSFGDWLLGRLVACVDGEPSWQPPDGADGRI